MEPLKKSKIYREFARALASLHQVDVDAIGLGKFGRLDNYCKRQASEFAYPSLGALFLLSNNVT